MAEERKIIIDVEVSPSQAAQKLSDTTAEIKRLKKENADMLKGVRNGTQLTAEAAARLAENKAQLKQLAAEEKMYTAQLNIAAEGNKEYGDSLVEMSAQLSQLKAEYRGMNKEQRESAGGQELLRSIQQLDGEMKAADATLGDFQRNVGNYASALGGSNKVVVQSAQLFAGGFRNGLTQAGTALKAFGKTMLATPVGWITAAVAALVKVLQGVRAAFQRSDEAGTAMQAAMARLQPVVAVVRKVFEGLAVAVAAVVGGITKAATAVVSVFVPAMREASKASEEAVLAQDRLEDTQRKNSEAQAARQVEIAKLNKRARSDERLTAKEREEIYREIDRLEQQTLKEKREMAKEELRILQQRAKDTADTSDAMKNKIVEARNAMLNAEAEYLNGTLRVAQREKAAREEQAREEEARQQERRRQWEEAKRRREEAARAELEEMRRLEDLSVQMIADAVERGEREVRLSFDRQIADIRKRLQEEKNLTTATREALNGQIVLLEAQKEAQIKEIRDKANADAIKAEQDRQRANIEALEAMEQERTAIIQQQQQHIMQEYANTLQRQLLEAGENARKAAEATLQYAMQERDTLLAMDAETQAALFGSVDEYRAAVLAAEREVAAARKQTQESLQQQVEQLGSTMQQVTGALSDLYEAAAGESESYEKFKKAMAIVDATISLATTIAAATQASTQGDPYTMAIRIAANVAAVTAQFAAVIKAIKAATIPSAGSFAEGGVVPGTAWEGDKLTARVSSGEMILTRRQQAELWELLHGGGYSGGIDYGRMAAAMVEAVAELPAPVLDYREFKRFERRVAAIENITKR